MARRGVATGLSAVLVLLTACSALPLLPEDPVALLGEAEGVGQDPDESLWFHALEDRPQGERVISHASRSGQLGESFVSAEEEASNTGGERNNVKGDKKDTEEPRTQETPREPEEVGNPYGQMMADMQNMKVSEKHLQNEHKRYQKLKYFAASQHEQDAVNEAITVVHQLAVARKPDRILDAAADEANDNLIESIDRRKKLEHLGTTKHGFTTKEYVPAPDAADPSLDGPFTQLWKLNKQMKDNEKGEQVMMSKFKTTSVAPSLYRALEPNKKKRRQLHADEDIFYAHSISGDANPIFSRKYYMAKKNEEQKQALMVQLGIRAREYKTAKTTNPTLTYQDFVKGTDLEGIDNFYAMGPREIEAETKKFNLLAVGMNEKEADLDKMQEDYIRKFSAGARMVPFAEWKRKYDLQRMVNAEVPDPDSMEIPEKTIAEDAAKMKEAYLHPDLQADVQTVLDVNKQQQMEHDMAVADIVSKAPVQADFDQMEKEKVLGTAELAEDTKRANEKLALETAHPNHYGPEKSFDPEEEPDYTVSDEDIQLQQKKKVERTNQKLLLRDARALRDSGQKYDLAVLDHDEDAALKGHPASNEAIRNSIISETKYYGGIQEAHGKETADDVKKGVYKRFNKEIQAWNKVKKGVLTGGVTPEYGAEALKSLPTRSGSPELDSDQAPPDSSGENEPLRKDEPPNDGSSKLPTEAETAVKASVMQSAAEDRPRTGYAPEDEDTPASENKTEEQVAAEAAAKDSNQASSEASLVEGTAGGIDSIAGKGETDKEMKKQFDNAAGVETSIEKAADSKAAANEVNEPEMPTVQSTQSDSQAEQEAAAEINSDDKNNQSQAGAHENGGMESDTSENGVPVR